MLLWARSGIDALHLVLIVRGIPIKQIAQSVGAQLAFNNGDGVLHWLAYVAVEYHGAIRFVVALPGSWAFTLLTCPHANWIDVLFPLG